MKYIKKIILGLAFAFTAISGNTHVAKADLLGVPAVSGKVVEHSDLTISTRRVGMVGNRPYPLVVKQSQSHTVITSEKEGVNVTTKMNSSTRTSVNEPYQYNSQGGTYYTSEGQKYYTDGNLNLSIVGSGSFND